MDHCVPTGEFQPQVVVSLGSLEALVAISGLLLLGTLVSWAVAGRRHIRQLQDARLKWQEEQRAAAAPREQATVCESFTAGWLNVLLQHLWPAFLEKRVSALFSRRITILLQRLMLSQGGKVPFKFISSIDLQEFGLGSAAPKLSSFKARYFAERNYLQFEFGLGFASSSSMQAMIAPKLKGGITGCVKFRRLSIKGRALLGLQLGSSAPGITALNFSFLEAPDIDVQITPLGLTVTDFPGVKSYIKDAIVTAISRTMVEPKRTATDVTALYARVRAEQQGGAGGLLVVTVLSAQGVKAPRPLQPEAPGSKQALSPRQPPQPASTGHQLQEPPLQAPECYCEMKAGAEVFRTPVKPPTSSPQWDWQFDCKLPAPIGSFAWAEELVFTVYDARGIGDPRVAGTCQVQLRELELIANAPPTDLYLPLLGPPPPAGSKPPNSSGAVAAGPAGDAPQIHLGFQLLQRPGSAPPRGVAPVPVPPGAAPVANQAHRAAEIRATSGVSWQLPPQPPAQGTEESRQLQELRQRLAAEQLKRQAAEKQFSTQAKENARLQRHLREKRLSIGGSSPALSSSPQLLSQTTSGFSSPGKQAIAVDMKHTEPPPEEAAGRGGRTQRIRVRSAFGEALGEAEMHSRRTKSAEQINEGMAQPPELSIPPSQAAALHLTSPRSDKWVSESFLNMSTDSSLPEADEQARGGNSSDDQPDSGPRAASESPPTSLVVGPNGPTRPGISTSNRSPSVELLVKLAKLERQLHSERQRFITEMEEMKMEALQLEEELASAQRRRLYEELRALCEGAKFRIHKSTGVQVRRVWLDPNLKALMWRAHKPANLQGGQIASNPSLTDDSKIDWSIGQDTAKKMPIKLIDQVVEGTDIFPKEMRRPWNRVQQLLGLGGTGGSPPQNHGQMTDRSTSSVQDPLASKDKDEANPTRSFSITFVNRTAIHLEIPPNGNGRSRMEWVSALTDLKNNLLDLGLQDPLVFPNAAAASKNASSRRGKARWSATGA